MNIIIQQPNGIGDVLFVQKICAHYAQEHSVYYPIHPQCWDAGIYRVKSAAITGPIGMPLPTDDVRVIDLGALQLPDNYFGTMTAKYTGLGLDWGDWAQYLKYERVMESEHRLREHFNLDIKEPFILFNKRYAQSKIVHGIAKSLPQDYDGRIIDMDILPGFNLFDWCWLLENAEEIHTVDTSVQYVMETLDLKASRLVVHPRHYAHTFYVIGQLFQQPWEWVDYSREEWLEVFPEQRAGDDVIWSDHPWLLDRQK